MRLFCQLQRSAISHIEHPLGDFDKHRIQRCLRKLAEVRYIGMRAASPARQNTAAIPAMPWITDLPGFKGDIVGFL
jgi:hypothetical protein